MDLHLRPRILLLTEAQPDAIRDALVARARANADTMDVRFARQQVMAWITKDARRLWSPCLDVNCRPHPKGTLIVGRLGPHMFLYTAMLFTFIGTGYIALLSLCWGYVQWYAGDTPIALFGVVPAVVAAVFFALLDRIGRRRAHQQMVELAQLLEGLGELQADEEGVLREVEDHRRALQGLG